MLSQKKSLAFAFTAFASSADLELFRQAHRHSLRHLGTLPNEKLSDRLLCELFSASSLDELLKPIKREKFYENPFVRESRDEFFEKKLKLADQFRDVQQIFGNRMFGQHKWSYQIGAAIFSCDELYVYIPIEINFGTSNHHSLEYCTSGIFVKHTTDTLTESMLRKIGPALALNMISAVKNSGELCLKSTIEDFIAQEIRREKNKPERPSGGGRIKFPNYFKNENVLRKLVDDVLPKMHSIRFESFMLNSSYLNSASAGPEEEPGSAINEYHGQCKYVLSVCEIQREVNAFINTIHTFKKCIGLAE